MHLYRVLAWLFRNHHNHFGTPPEQAERSALMVYFASTLMGSAMSMFTKLCALAGMHFFLLVAFRSALLCLLVTPMLVQRQVNPFALNKAFPLLVLRGVTGFLSLSLWCLSLQLLPLSDANALSFISPVMVAAVAPYILGDITPRAVYWSMPACLAGMLMVAQPTWLFGVAAAPTSQMGVAAGVLQAVFSAGSKLSIRALNKHNEPLESIMFSMGSVSTLGGLLGCLVLPGEQLLPPDAATGWLLLCTTSLMAFVVQLTFTYSCRKCNASAAASLDYLTLLWTLLADALVFRRLPSRLSCCGAAIIAAASLGAMLWTSARPAAAAEQESEEAAAAAAAKPLAYKKQHYLSAAAGARAQAGAGSSSSSEAEAVSLIRAETAASLAAAVAEKAARAAAPGTAGWAGAAGVAASAAVAAGTEALATAKLACAGWLTTTDSSKSWWLGTELDAPPAGAGAGSDADACDRAAAAAGAGVQAAAGPIVAGVELQAVVALAAAMRTSSEKELVLVAAGK